MPFPCRIMRTLLPILVLSTAAATVARAQDPPSLPDQMNALIQQMQGATDPCPFMPKFKSLMTQLANQSPEVFQAMKPVLDLMNADDTCAKPADPAPTQASPPEPPYTLTPEQREALRQANLKRLQAAEQRARQLSAAQATNQTSGQPGLYGTGAAGAGPECKDVTSSVTLKVTSPHGFSNCGGEVVGHFTNNLSEAVTCTTAFHHNGVWDDYGMGYVKPGQTTGGELGGFWTCSADKNEIRYVCFLGSDPTDVKGRFCNTGFKWTD